MTETYVGFENAVGQLQEQTNIIAPGFNEKVAVSAAPAFLHGEIVISRWYDDDPLSLQGLVSELLGG